MGPGAECSPQDALHFAAPGTSRTLFSSDMGRIMRFGVSMDEELVGRFDAFIRRQGYRSRSEAIRDLVRDRLVRREWEEGDEVVGVIILLYDHHQRELSDRLTDLQHHDHSLIHATMHIHLDPDNCLEVLTVRGQGRELQNLADRLTSLKGVKHGRLAATSTGKTLH